MKHSDQFRSLLAAGLSREKALAELRHAGASPLDCIGAIHDVESVGVVTAKRLVAESASWCDVFDRSASDHILELESHERDQLAILEIGRETTSRGAGLSLSEALSQTRYLELRPFFSEADVLRILKGQPALVEGWLAYSEDKRTSGGWYVLRSGAIGQVGQPSTTMYSSMIEAVAAYVLRELDFWAEVGAG